MRVSTQSLHYVSEYNSISSNVFSIYSYRGGGGGGVTTYIFLIRMYPVKTKGEPKAGAANPNLGQIIHVIKMRPKAGETGIAYKKHCRC